MFTLFWLVIILASIVYNRAHIPGDLRLFRDTWASFRPRHFLTGLGSITSVLVTAVALYWWVPPLRFGWLVWLAGRASSTDTGEVVETSPVFWVVIGVFLCVFFVFVPTFARNEELAFRLDHVWSPMLTRLWSSLKFGLIHLLMGIPIAAALALSVAGHIFLLVARRAAKASRLQDPLESALVGVDESAKVHAAHNYIAVTVMFVSVILVIVGA